MLLGWGLGFGGELGRALIWQEKALAFAESSGESVYRGYALWSLGVGWWQKGKPDRAEQLLTDALQVSQLVNDPARPRLVWRPWHGSPTQSKTRGVPLR